MSNVLAIGDKHGPFTHRNYLPFCKAVAKEYRCTETVDMGDEADNHGISFHEVDPDGLSPGDEMDKAEESLREWFGAFKNVRVCISNHGSLVYRKGKSSGLPSRVFKSYKELWKAPHGWDWNLRWEIDGVQYIHGMGFSGVNGAITAAKKHRQSTVIGHIHSHGGVLWSASHRDLIFGLNAGCGIDIKAYAFAYGKDFPERPTLGCGVVYDNGKRAEFIPMPM
jgi:hypothetical protein